jgi:hypothetical protein
VFNASNILFQNETLVLILGKRPHPPGPLSDLIRPSGTFSPHPPFGHLLLKEKEIGILAFLEKGSGLFYFLERARLVQTCELREVSISGKFLMQNR